MNLDQSWTIIQIFLEPTAGHVTFFFFIKLRLYPEVVVFVVGVVGAATVVEPSKLGINGAVVAGGATTFPLLRLTAPKADVMVDSEVAEVVPGVGVAEAA